MSELTSKGGEQHMGEMTLWDRIWPWFRHPVDMASGAITARYLDRHGLVMEYADRYDAMRSRLNGI